MFVQLSLGSNLGDRASALQSAVRALSVEKSIRLTNYSHCYETEPIGVKDQPAFLNMAVEIETELDPLELLKTVKMIEQELGRKKTSHWGPREIDIDLILWGQTVFTSERLTLPHKDFRQRAFVLVPMAEIVPEAVDPVSGLTIADLAQRPDVEGWIKRKEKIVP